MYSVYFAGELRGTFADPGDAAMFVACLGVGAEIRMSRRVFWREGFESQEAAESYDHVAATVDARLAAWRSGRSD